MNINKNLVINTTLGLNLDVIDRLEQMKRDTYKSKSELVRKIIVYFDEHRELLTEVLGDD